MSPSSRTPDGHSAFCRICQSDIVIETSLSHGDATCPNCGSPIWLTGFRRSPNQSGVSLDTVVKGLEIYLNRTGLRQTEQRRTVAKLVCKIESPFTAEQILGVLPRRGDPGYITTATVYRTLRELVDAGILTFVGDGGSCRYSLNSTA